MAENAVFKNIHGDQHRTDGSHQNALEAMRQTTTISRKELISNQRLGRDRQKCPRSRTR
jgi:hypothetical protein